MNDQRAGEGLWQLEQRGNRAPPFVPFSYTQI